MAESSYVVQKFYGGESVWKDVATVDVPPRTKRPTILRKALTDNGLNGEGVYRVLDGEAAEEMRVSWKQMPPQMVIG